MTEHLMQLTTTVAPAKTFTVDEAVYELLGMDHLSAKGEASVMAAFSRYGNMAERLEKTTDQAKAEKVALDMRNVRLEILAQMTTCPVDVLGQIPMSGQVQMMQALQTEMEVDSEDEEDDA